MPRAKNGRTRTARIEELLAQHAREQHTDPTAALDAATRAVKAARMPGDSALRLRALLSVAGTAHQLARFDEAIERAQDARELANDLNDRIALAKALQTIAVAHTNTGRINDALPLLLQAVDIAEELNDAELIASTNNSLGVAYHCICDYAHALEHYQSSQTAAERADDRYSACMASGNIGLVRMLLGDLPGALTHTRQSLDLAIEAGFTINEINARANLATIATRMKEPVAARAEFTAALEGARRLGLQNVVGYALCGMAQLESDANAFSEAAALFKSAVEAMSPTGDADLWQILVGLGTARARIGDNDGAEQALREALDGARRQGERLVEASALDELASLYESIGDVTRALDCLRGAMAAREEAIGHQQQQALADMKVRESIAHLRREHDEARLANQQLEAERSRQQRELTALARDVAEHVQFLNALRRKMRELGASTDEETRSRLRDIERQIESQSRECNGWEAFDAQFDSVHQGFGGRLLEQQPNLTPTELRVCTLLKINMPSKQIADILGISHRTVENHRTNLRRKLRLADGVHLPAHLAKI